MEARYMDGCWNETIAHTDWSVEMAVKKQLRTSNLQTVQEKQPLFKAW